jgi:acyl carrier protein
MRKRTAPVVPTEPQTVAERVRRIIAVEMAVGDEEVTGDTRLEGDLGVDELDMVEIAMECEDAFKVEITDDEIDDMWTKGLVRDVVAIVERKAEAR